MCTLIYESRCKCRFFLLFLTQYKCIFLILKKTDILSYIYVLQSWYLYAYFFSILVVYTFNNILSNQNILRSMDKLFLSPPSAVSDAASKAAYYLDLESSSSTKNSNPKVCFNNYHNFLSFNRYLPPTSHSSASPNLSRLH